MDQIQQVCESYDVEDEGVFKNKNINKHSSTKTLKISFLLYCFIVTMLLLLPFLTVFLYDNESKGLVQFLVASTKRAYYLSSVNLYDMDIILNDKYYYGEGQELALLTETYEKLSTLENDLKNGKYGGKSASGYPFFKQFHNNPGCIRSDMVKYHYNCTNRAFDEYYTKELAESSTDYLMIEYLNKLNEFINNPPVGKKI